MHHDILFNYFESGTKVSDICHNSTNIHHRFQLQKTHRETIQLSRFKLTKHTHYTKHTKYIP